MQAAINRVRAKTEPTIVQKMSVHFRFFSAMGRSEVLVIF